jgi:hypothetical protein
VSLAFWHLLISLFYSLGLREIERQETTLAAPKNVERQLQHGQWTRIGFVARKPITADSRYSVYFDLVVFFSDSLQEKGFDCCDSSSTQTDFALHDCWIRADL